MTCSQWLWTFGLKFLLFPWIIISLILPTMPVRSEETGPPPESEVGKGWTVAQASEMPEESDSTLSLSLRECLVLALDNNLNIALARYNPQENEARIEEEKADFHPLATFNADKGRQTTPQPSRFQFFGRGIASRVFDDTGMDWGIRQKFASGTDYDFKVDFSREVDNPFGRRDRRDSSGRVIIPRGPQSEYLGNLSLTFRQHLLRGLGYDVNRSEILVAQNNLEVSKQDFKEKVEDTIALVEQTYWDLVFSIEDLQVKQQSLELARDLLKRNEIQVRVGTMAPIEILEAKTQVAAREDDIIRAEKSVKDVEDRLRKLINLPDYPLLREVKILPSDKPAVHPKEIPLVESIHLALQNRSDYRRAKLDLENRDIEVKVNKNGLLPSFDVVAHYGSNSLEQGLRGSVTDLFDGSQNNWRFGINVEIPLGNQAARSRYTQARIEREKVQTTLENLEQDIILTIREAVRAVQTNMKRVETTRIASQLFKERLETEEKRFGVGLSTSRDILEDQEQLAEARSREIQATIDYNKSQVELERKRGTILDKNKIKLF